MRSLFCFFSLALLLSASSCGPYFIDVQEIDLGGCTVNDSLSIRFLQVSTNLTAPVNVQLHVWDSRYSHFVYAVWADVDSCSFDCGGEYIVVRLKDGEHVTKVVRIPTKTFVANATAALYGDKP